MFLQPEHGQREIYLLIDSLSSQKILNKKIGIHGKQDWQNFFFMQLSELRVVRIKTSWGKVGMEEVEKREGKEGCRHNGFTPV